jgi:SM-20-related protein
MNFNYREMGSNGEIVGKRGEVVGENGRGGEGLFPISQQIGVLREIWELDFPKGPLPSPYVQLPFQIFRGLFPPEELEEMVANFHRGEAEVAGLVGGGIDKGHRNTLLHTPTPEVRELFHRKIAEILPEIERFFQVRLIGGTDLQLLEYRPGGFYDCHADNASLLLQGGEVVGFKIVRPERQITTLLFLNREFEGGELEFCFLRWLPGTLPPEESLRGGVGETSNGETPLSLQTGGVDLAQIGGKRGERVILKPEPGMLVVFPSGGLFAHQVHPVQRGRRFAIVKWWRVL